MDVNIHYTRLSASGTMIFHEELVADNGQRLTTHVVLTEVERQQMSEANWKSNLLPQGYLLASLRKHYYYHEYFTVLECFNLAGDLAGYYSDIATPVRKVGDDYYLTDLFLDYWVRPGQAPMALDEDEFAAGVEAGVMTTEQIERAQATFTRLHDEIAAGIFPFRYIEA